MSKRLTELDENGSCREDITVRCQLVGFCWCNQEGKVYRRSILALLYAALFAFIASAQAETGDELVAKNLVARGGADKLAAIHSYVIKGELR
jgi:hypothetical protein